MLFQKTLPDVLLKCLDMGFVLRTGNFLYQAIKTNRNQTKTITRPCQGPLSETIGFDRDGWIFGQEIYPLLLEPIFCWEN